MKTKIFISTILLFALLSCTNKDAKQENSTRLDPVETFPIETIKRVCFERKAHYNLDSLNLSRLKTIDSTFFKKWFDNKKVSNIENTNIKFDRYSRYYFFDFKDLDKLFLFSIVYDDEIGYNSLYHFTFDKEKKEIIQIDLIAQTGGDGGEGNKDILNFNQKGDKLVRTSISTYDEDFDKGYTRQSDSTTTDIEFNFKKTKFKKINSTSKLDTIWNKK